jgi:hypothetical protein
VLGRGRRQDGEQDDVRAGLLGALAVEGAQLGQLGRLVPVPVTAVGRGADADPSLPVELDGVDVNPSWVRLLWHLSEVDEMLDLLKNYEP